MPINRNWQLIRCCTCGKPLMKCCLNDNKNLQSINLTMEEFNYDEISQIYLCTDCYKPEQVVEKIS